jgi:hypothetical protein
MTGTILTAALLSYLSLQARPSGGQVTPSKEIPTPPGVAYTNAIPPENRRVFYGDLHLHTTYSNDAWNWGTKVTPAMAYAFAKGETVKVPAVQVRSEEGVPLTSDVAVRRSWPLDFMAVTDHAESLGGNAQFDYPESPRGQTEAAKQYRANPTHGGRGRGGRGAAGTVQEPPPFAAGAVAGRGAPAAPAQGIAAAPATGGAAAAGTGGGAAAAGAGGGRGADPLMRDPGWMSRIWQETIKAANDAYEPGKFTALIGYEWTATRGGWIHRNVIFNGATAPPPFSASQSTRPEDLWTYLESVRAAGQDVLAIPHNSNYNNSGFVFDWNTSDDKPIDQVYAQRRALNEPLVEIGQNKGTSETTPGLSPNDEFANFEVFDTVRNSTIGGKYVRQAYGRGLVIESKVGANPYKMGIVGASDIHNGLSVSYEDGFAGGHFGIAPNILPTGNYARNTLGLAATGPNGATERAPDGDASILWAPGSLTGVWAEENTRNAIFAALKRKETFATSGTRLRLRMFGGWSYSADLLRSRDWIKEAYAQGVAMGADLPVRPANAAAPTFVLQAMKDADGANLDRIQIVKVWLDGERAMEKVFDVAVSGSRTIDPATGRAKAAVGNTVDLQTGKYSNNIGAAMLSTVWRDPAFDADQAAVYYARVLEIPTPRWSTLLAIKNRLPLSTEVPATIQERGWSSPIWYTPPKR